MNSTVTRAGNRRTLRSTRPVSASTLSISDAGTYSPGLPNRYAVTPAPRLSPVNTDRVWHDRAPEAPAERFDLGRSDALQELQHPSADPADRVGVGVSAAPEPRDDHAPASGTPRSGHRGPVLERPAAPVRTVRSRVPWRPGARRTHTTLVSAPPQIWNGLAGLPELSGEPRWSSPANSARSRLSKWGAAPMRCTPVAGPFGV
jgi:hypothetical protein